MRWRRRLSLHACSHVVRGRLVHRLDSDKERLRQRASVRSDQQRLPQFGDLRVHLRLQDGLYEQLGLCFGELLRLGDMQADVGRRRVLCCGRRLSTRALPFWNLLQCRHLWHVQLVLYRNLQANRQWNGLWQRKGLQQRSLRSLR